MNRGDRLRIVNHFPYFSYSDDHAFNIGQIVCYWDSATVMLKGVTRDVYHVYSEHEDPHSGPFCLITDVEFVDPMPKFASAMEALKWLEEE